MKIKVVYNTCYGDFILSKEAIALYVERKFNGVKPDTFYSRDIDRTCPVLVKVIEELGSKANGECAELSIAEFEIEVNIEYYDGSETPKIHSWKL